MVPDPAKTIRDRAIAAWPPAWHGQNLRDIVTTLGIDIDVGGRVGRRVGRGRSGWLAAGRLVQMLAGHLEVGAVDIEPVDRARGQSGGAQDGVEIGRGLQIGGDAARREHVEQVLADARIHVARDRVVGRVEPVVPPPATGATRCHPCTLPRRPCLEW